MLKTLTTSQSQELTLAKTKKLMDITAKILNKRVIKKQTNTLTPQDNSYILPKMIKIESGSFMMGNNDYEDEQPIHKVIINKVFLMGKYQVTFKEYDKFCEDTHKEKPDDEGWGRKNRPVINVSWDDAKKYCTWLSKKTNKNYHLPSETQWEYTCRAGTNTEYSFGYDQAQLKDYAWYDQNSYDLGSEHKDYGTHSVGEKKVNPWGLYDMHGNVWEWCEDCYEDNYENSPRDESPNRKGENKVLRGASWFNSPNLLRSAFRYGNFRGGAISFFGFRLAGTLP